MGVPKFFRYISERYPNLSELVGTKELPQFDNMYLDMNGIIHVCSHPDDSNVHFRITEEQIFRDIFHYLDTLFRLIQPQKLFFMAVDGVAPRAKMNQQRGRRFRSAKDAIDLIERAKQKGEQLPTESRFDSNCITPGTSFMARLQEALKHFVKTKLSTDPSWHNCRFILSGHETPGEGEHKIMEYIRYLKSKPDYDPNTRHCLYGLDADLMMLGLCTHELQFSLLREEVKFGKKAKRATSVDETRFFLLHLGLLREYLELEFSLIKDKISFGYDIERIIDDWIFMCFLVGNDFIPHLPNLHINSNALPVLYRTYMAVLPNLDGYINESGKLNLARLEAFMTKLAEVDRDLFKEHYADFKMLDTKYDNAETFDVDVGEILSADTKSDLDALVKNTMLDFGSSSEGSCSESNGYDVDSNLAMSEEDYDEEEDDNELFEKEFRLHKRNYYINKLKYPEMTDQVLAEQTECYITALQWTLSYYYRGVCSWGWFYPHHYAPFISDITNFKDLNIHLIMGRPFLPFQQLLAVLPSASKELLPDAYHKLMTHPTSKLIEYYPVDFETDLNGKKQDWEALVLIPFIDEEKLINAMNECNDDLSESEKQRNIHGPMCQYDYCSKDNGPLADSPYGQSGVAHLFCKETLINREEVQVPQDKLVLGPCKGSVKNEYFPGFPTMRHLEHSATIKAERVKVFEHPSRSESVIIKIDEKPLNVDIDELAKLYLDKEIYVGWPHLREAKVIAVSDNSTKIDKFGKDSIPDNREFMLHVKQLLDHHLTRMGIDLGEIKQLLHVVPLLNREYINTNDNKLTLQKQWSKIPLAVAPITVVQNIIVHHRSMEQFKTIESVFIKDSTVFMMNNVYYGSQGTVIDPVVRNGRLKISIVAHPQPDFSHAIQVHYNDGQVYTNSYNASSTIGLNVKIFNRITGTILLVTGEKRFPLSDSANKTNVGLQLKFPKQNEELADYTKNENNQWLYSHKAIELVEMYWLKFPKLFELLTKKSHMNDFIFESELNEDKEESEESYLKQITKWLKEQPHNTAVRRNCGTNTLEKNTVEAIIDAVTELKKSPVRCIKLQVKPHLLYKPNLNDITVNPDPSATYAIFDRVVIARDGYSVPLGARGTIISIQPLVDSNPVRQENINAVEYFYEVLFDEPFEGGHSFSNTCKKRLFRVRQSVLINISHGLGLNRKENHINNKNAVAPQQWRTNQSTQSQTQQEQWRIKQTNDNQAQPEQWRRKDQKNRNNLEKEKVDTNTWPALNSASSGNKKQNNPQKIGKQGDQRNTRPFDNRVIADNNKSISIKKRELNQFNATQNLNVSQRKPMLEIYRSTKTDENTLTNIPLSIKMNELSVVDKLESTVASNKAEQPSPSLLNDSSIITKNQPLNDSGDSSDALKKLLGINSHSLTAKNEPPSHVESHSIDLNSLFGKSASNDFTQIQANQLPKPPLTWHTNKTKEKTIQKNHGKKSPTELYSQVPVPNFIPFQNENLPFYQQPPHYQPPRLPQSSGPMQHLLQYPPPGFRTNNSQMFFHNNNGNNPNNPHHGNTLNQQHLPHNGMPFSHPHMNGIAANFSYRPPEQAIQIQQNQVHRQGPNGPANLSNNSKHFPGHGAFIPLQAIRKNTKPKTLDTSQAQQSTSKVVNPTASAPIHEQIKGIKDQIIKESQKKRTVSKEIQPKSQAKPQKGKDEINDRPKRLAAKFDLPPV